MLDDFSMPIPDRTAQARLPSRLMQVELAYNTEVLRQQYQDFMQKANANQKKILEEVTAAVDAEHLEEVTAAVDAQYPEV